MDEMMTDKEALYRAVLMDHYKNPKNKIIESNTEGYEVREGLNPSCGDEVTVFLKWDGDILEDIKFSGSGCSICMASASVMTNELSGLTKNEVIKKISKFFSIIKEGVEENVDEFEDGQVFSGVSKFPPRIKCAFLSWEIVMKIIEEK